MKRIWLFFVFFSSLAGSIVSFFATKQYINVKNLGAESDSFCNISQTVNCDQVYATSYADFLGQPASLWGIAFFVWLALLSLVTLRQNEKNSQKTAEFGLILSFGGLLFCLYKAYISLFVLKTICILCVTTYIATFLGLLGWCFYLGIRFSNLGFLKMPTRWILHALLTAFFISAVVAGGSAYLKKKIPTPDLAGLSVKDLVQFHFQQSEYQLEESKLAPVWGNPNAKVTLVVFSDFECPFCRHAALHLKPLLYEFKNEIRFIFQSYPLDQSCNDNMTGALHQNACMAALAAHCAQKQGIFWAFHDAVFKNQAIFHEGKEKVMAFFVQFGEKEGGWTKEVLSQCMDNPETMKILKSDIANANKSYITGTPTLLLNNRRLKNWVHPEVFRAILKEEIKRSH